MTLHYGPFGPNRSRCGMYTSAVSKNWRRVTCLRCKQLKNNAGSKNAQLYYCETAAAVSSRWHLRYSTEPRKLGGGAKTKTLCGLQAAWDINRDVGKAPIEPLTCRGCHRAWLHGA